MGSIVSQGVGLAVGIQDKFSWAGVAEAAIGGGIGAGVGGISGLSGGGFFGAVGRGLISNTLTQGIEVATGLQKSFNWAETAAAGVAAGVGYEVGDMLGIEPTADGNYNGPAVGSMDYAWRAGLSGMAGAIAGAATRSVISGTDFGDNIMAALPDAIGNTIGNMITGAIGGNSAAQASGASQAGSTTGLSQAELDDIMNTVNNLPAGQSLIGDTGGAYTPLQLAVSQEIAGNNEYGYPILKTDYNDGSYIDQSQLPPLAAILAPQEDNGFDTYADATADERFANTVVNAIIDGFHWAGRPIIGKDGQPIQVPILSPVTGEPIRIGGSLSSPMLMQTVHNGDLVGAGIGMVSMLGPLASLGRAASVAPEIAAAETGGLRVASGFGNSAPASVVRTIQPGERVADIINEGKSLTFTTGNEHAVVTLANGERALVSGGPGGIDFAEGSVTRIFGHSHPTSAPPSAADSEATLQLGQSRQYVFHGGRVTVVRPPR